MNAERAGRRVRRVRGWMVLVRLLRSYLRPYAWQTSLLVALVGVQAAGLLYLPDLNADIINNGVVTGDLSYIWRLGEIMIGIVFVLGALAVITVYLASSVSMSVGARMRDEIHRRVLSFSEREMNRFGIPSLITRNVNDVHQIQQFLQMALTQLFIAIIMSVGAMIMAVRESPVLSWLFVITMPVTALVIGVLVATLVPLGRAVQVRLDQVNQVLREQVTGVRVIRAFLRTRSEQDRFREANDGITRTVLRTTRIFAAVMPLVLVIANLSSVAVIWFGGRLVSEGSMPIGNMSAFLIYILQTLVYIGTAVNVLVLVPRAVASAERIQQVLSVVPDVADPPRPVVRRKASGVVKFRDVIFGYPGSERPVLNGLSFILQPGQTTAIIGGTGSGKTTLINLIPRFFDVTGGAVLVNGNDVRKVAAEQLWATIGLVPQRAYLVAGTVASNLRFGVPEATDEQLWQALDIAQALDFVSSMPGQLDARIDQGGTNVSGGQRQRLAIARALVRRPRIYLFDDCFSALDVATDARLRGALREHAQDATVAIVAQRVSTIMHADQIIVVEAGEVAGIGTHEQLLASCATYQEIAASQLGEEAA